MSTFLDLPSVGSELFLHTHLLVREDAQILYGFGSLEERGLFRMLLRISGVGAKMGLAVLSAMSAADFQRCVEYEDAATLVKIPGVGKKTAERLIIEMRDKIEKSALAPGATRVDVEASPKSEAVDALIALGYKASEVNKLIGAMDVDEQSAEDIIRQALRQAAH
jgi:Holliday junction DNA helicase RuvA